MKGERKLRDIVRAASLELIELQNRLHKIGLIRTAHKANAAIKELGWEAAEMFEKKTVGRPLTTVGGSVVPFTWPTPKRLRGTATPAGNVSARNAKRRKQSEL